jgi:hypothetical protein
MRTKEGIKAASATYRKATKQVSKKLKVDFKHSKYPSDDFKEIVGLIPKKIKEKALKWYKMGIRRGLMKATGMMLDGEIYRKGNTVYCPSRFDVRVKTRFSGEEWVQKKYKIKAEDIGFE